jgi:hypothetical protein
VLVLRESKSPGWLEILPPPGSFSWINAKYMQQPDPKQNLAYVNCDPSQTVPILPGSREVDQPPISESVKLTRGTQVVILGVARKVGTESLVPILPHSNEVRYLSAQAVRPATVVSTNNTPTNWTLNQGTTTTPGGFMANSVLADAEKARQSGDTATAQRLYTQVVQTTTDANQKQYAQNMLANLQSPYTPASRTVMSPANATPTQAGANLIMQSPPAWSVYGRLHDVKIAADNGQPLYALQDAQGKTIVYVTTQAGKSLTDYNGRTVSVYGATMYRSDTVRMQYIVATHVAVP